MDGRLHLYLLEGLGLVKQGDTRARVPETATCTHRNSQINIKWIHPSPKTDPLMEAPTRRGVGDYSETQMEDGLQPSSIHFIGECMGMAYRAELWGIKKGLMLPWTMGIRN
ncbi:hypothetical protein AAHE18_19G163000 [Arachis hypogaea]